MLPTRGTVQRFNGLDESDQCLRIISLLLLLPLLAVLLKAPWSPAAMHSSEPNCSRPATHYISMNLRSSQQDSDSNKTCQAYFSKFLYWFVCLPWAQKTIWSMVEQASIAASLGFQAFQVEVASFPAALASLVGTLRVATSIKVCE